MRGVTRSVACAIALGIVGLAIYVPPSAAASGDLAQEWMREWCNTCPVLARLPAGVNGIAVGDLSGDGIPEIVAVGIDDWQSEISVFNWYGGQLTLIQRFRYGPLNSFLNQLNGAAIGTFGGGGTPVLVTIGTQPGPGGAPDWQAEMRVWQWVPPCGCLIESVSSRTTWHDGTQTTPEGIVLTPPVGGWQDAVVVSHHKDPSGAVVSEVSRWVPDSVPSRRAFTTSWLGEVRGVALGDTDGDGTLNVVAGGRQGTSPPYDGFLRLWRLDDGGFTALGVPLARVGGSVDGYTFEEVAIADVDLDTRNEIVATGGADPCAPSEFGEVTVWTHLTGPDRLSLEATSGNIASRYYRDLTIGQIDQDSEWESVAVGTSQVSGGYGAFSIWQHGLNSILLETHYDSTPETTLEAAAMGDPDVDGVIEFLTGGTHTASSAPYKAQLAAWTLSSAAEWPQFHRDSAHSGWSGAVAPNTPNVPWSKVLMVGGAYGHDRYSPIVYAQKVYVVVHATLRAYTVGGLDAWPGPVSVPDDVLDFTVRSLAAGNGRVFYGGTVSGPPPGGVLSAYRASDGGGLWTLTFSEQLVWAPVALAGDRVLAGTAGALPGSPAGQVLAFDLAGNPLWTFAPGSDVMAAVAVVGTQVYVRAGTELYSIPLDDPNGDGVISNPGEIEWKFSMGTWGGPRHDLALTGSPSVAGDFVYVGSQDGFLYKIPRSDPTPGDGVMSMADVTAGGGWRSISLGDWVASTPTVFEGAVYVGADQTFDSSRPANAHLYRLDDATGQQIVWTQAYYYLVATSSPSVADGKVFLWAQPSTTSAYVYAYTLSGNALWSKIVHDRGCGSRSARISVALSAGYLFTSNGCSVESDPNYSEHAFLLAIKDP